MQVYMYTRILYFIYDFFLNKLYARIYIYKYLKFNEPKNLI